MLWDPSNITVLPQPWWNVLCTSWTDRLESSCGSSLCSSYRPIQSNPIWPSWKQGTVRQVGLYRAPLFLRGACAIRLGRTGARAYFPPTVVCIARLGWSSPLYYLARGPEFTLLPPLPPASPDYRRVVPRVQNSLVLLPALDLSEHPNVGWSMWQHPS